MKSWLQWGVGAVLAGWLLAAQSPAATSDVFRLQTLIKGTKNNPGAPATTLTITETQLSNLSLGLPVDNPAPANVRLGLVTRCANNDLRIIVYNQATQSNLVTIGNLQTVSVVENRRGTRYTRNVISELTFTVPTGAAELFTGGICYAAGSILSDSNQCFLSYHANIIGALVSSGFLTNINVASTTLTASGKQLGILIEP